MGLVKLTRWPNELQNGPVVKELSDRFYVLLLKDGVPVCFETRSAPMQMPSGQIELLADARQLQVYTDDGVYWIHHTEDTRPQANKWAPPQASGFGLGGLVQDAAVPSAPHPAPLVPFAGLDKKAMPPSPLLAHKQAKPTEPTGKGASRKISFSADQGQKQISEYFVKPNNQAISPTEMEF